MEWHLGLVALTVLGVFWPWAFVLVAAGIGYSAWYCVATAAQANLDVLVATEGPATWSRRLRWRAMLAWLYFLEPVARDWGRLKNGLTPWRSALPAASSAPGLSRWWQRLQPFRRTVGWICPGGVAMEKHTFLERVTRKLTVRGIAVGWNLDWQDWDLKIGRGTLGEARLRLVVEHHGGPRRLARFAATLRPSGSFYWLFGALAASAAVVGAFGLQLGLAVHALLAMALWIAPIAEANRLESAMRSAADEVAGERQPDEPMAVAAGGGSVAPNS
jgi:hypothetical protein